MIQEAILLEKKFDDNGYIKVFINKKWILEQRWIVEQFILRELTSNEVIHHIDNNKLNNNLDNLLLFNSQKEHKSFENKIRQFGKTNPIKREILKIKELMLIERSKNLGVEL